MLRQIHERHVFDDATTDERRTGVYVRPGELGLTEARADVDLMRALAELDPPRRLHVVGPSGAGKTSLVLRVVADLARRRLGVTHEVLVLRVGDQPQRLVSTEEFMKMILETIAVEGYRFANVSEEVLDAAAADERTQIPLQVEHRAGINAPVVSYSASLKEAYATLQFGQSAAKVRHDLEDVLRLVVEAGHRPVLVLDDTEKFVSPGPDGTLDAESVDNLYHHGVRALCELPVDVVVVMHPRFEDVGRVQEVIERYGMERIDVPELPAATDSPALGRILRRRMERDDIDTALEDVIDAAAVEDLQILYHERDSDLRSVLKLAHGAAEVALRRGASTIEARDVREVVAGAQR